MSTFKNSFIVSVLYGILAFGLIYVMTSGGLGVSADSENYLMLADCFTQKLWGKAFNPIWPPLYPMTIAAVDILGSAELLGAARIISILSFVILVITIFPLGLHLQGKITAHLSAFSVMSLAPFIYLYCFCWSETFYTMLSLLFFLIFMLFLKAPKERKTKYLILSGVFAGLATITRYVGYSLIATGILSILFLSNYHPISKRIKKTLTFALMAGIPVFLHYLSHFYYWALTSKSHYASPHSFTHQLFLFFSTIYHDLLSFDLSFWRYAFLFEWGLSFSWVRLITIICMLFLSVLFFKAVLFSKLDKGSLRLQIPMIFYLVLYSSIVLYTSSTIAIDPIGSRFTVPLYPFLLLLVFSGISHGYKSFTPRKTKMLFISLALLGIASFWVIQIISTMSIYQGISSGSLPAMEQPGNLNRESIKFLKKNAGPNDFIITNIPRKLGYIWPRQEGYGDIPKRDWEKAVSRIIYESSRRSVYFLICTQDYSPSGITVEIVEVTDEEMGLFHWKRVFGNDHIYKTKRVVLGESRKFEKRE